MANSKSTKTKTTASKSRRGALTKRDRLMIEGLEGMRRALEGMPLPSACDAGLARVDQALAELKKGDNGE